MVNIPEFFLSHRLPLAIAARAAGHEVHVATGAGAASARIMELGFPHHELAMSRSGTGLLAELGSLYALYRLMRRERPDVVHLVTIKPVLYGGLMARFAGVPGVLAAISGLGTIFIAEGLKAGIVRRAIECLYRVALGKANTRVIFQNTEDRDTFIRLGIIPAERTILIRGSGVDLADYPHRPEPEGIPVVTLAGRLLKDKGVREYIEAIRLLKAEGIWARFQLAGNTDPSNPTSLTDAEVESWSREGLVEVLGYRTDIADLFANANLVVLPSYREGLPKVLAEAAAVGRAVVTTDVPGCRDAIEHGETGLLVPVRDAAALAGAIRQLLDQPERRKGMGEKARRFAEQHFRIEGIIEQHLAAYNLLDRAGRE